MQRQLRKSSLITLHVKTCQYIDVFPDFRVISGHINANPLYNCKWIEVHRLHMAHAPHAFPHSLACRYIVSASGSISIQQLQNEKKSLDLNFTYIDRGWGVIYSIINLTASCAWALWANCPDALIKLVSNSPDLSNFDRFSVQSMPSTGAIVHPRRSHK